MENIPTKKCNGCLEELPHDQFKRFKNNRLYPRCLFCYRLQARENRKKRKEKEKLLKKVLEKVQEHVENETKQVDMTKVFGVDRNVITPDNKDKAVVSFVNKINNILNINKRKIDAVNEAYNEGYDEGYERGIEESDED